jgi:hypothetical protein
MTRPRPGLIAPPAVLILGAGAKRLHRPCRCGSARLARRPDTRKCPKSNGAAFLRCHTPPFRCLDIRNWPEAPGPVTREARGAYFRYGHTPKRSKSNGVAFALKMIAGIFTPALLSICAHETGFRYDDTPKCGKGLVAVAGGIGEPENHWITSRQDRFSRSLCHTARLAAQTGSGARAPESVLALAPRLSSLDRKGGGNA